MWHRIETTSPNVSGHTHTHTHGARIHTKNVYTYHKHDVNDAEWFYFIDYIWLFLDSFCLLFLLFFRECCSSRTRNVYVWDVYGVRSKQQQQQQQRNEGEDEWTISSCNKIVLPHSVFRFSTGCIIAKETLRQDYIGCDPTPIRSLHCFIVCYFLFVRTRSRARTLMLYVSSPYPLCCVFTSFFPISFLLRVCSIICWHGKTSNKTRANWTEKTHSST